MKSIRFIVMMKNLFFIATVLAAIALSACNGSNDNSKEQKMRSNMKKDPSSSDGKGAMWLSEVEEIKNPYMGSKMPTCGSVEEKI